MKHKLFCTASLCASLFLAGNGTGLLAQHSRSSHREHSGTTARKSSTTPGQYPESSERLLTERDVEHVTPWGLKVMMNEIYARHGFIFRDAALKKHFKKEKWYRGKEKSMNRIRLSDTEVQNLAFLKQHQGKARL